MASQSVWYRAMLDIQGVIQSQCPLTPISSPAATGTLQSSFVLVQQVEEQLNVPNFPACIVTNQDMEEEEGDDSDFENDETVYPVAVVIVDSARGDFRGVQPDYLLWREILRRKFQGLVNPPVLQNTPEVSLISLVNLKAIPANIAAMQWYAMGFVVRCRAWQPRVRGGDGT